MYEFNWYSSNPFRHSFLHVCIHKVHFAYTTPPQDPQMNSIILGFEQTPLQTSIIVRTRTCFYSVLTVASFCSSSYMP